MAITLFAISTNNMRIERMSFEAYDEPFTQAGYNRVFRDLSAPGSSARFRSVGASNGGKIVDVVSLLGSSWEDTEANVRAALA